MRISHTPTLAAMVLLLAGFSLSLGFQKRRANFKLVYFGLYARSSVSSLLIQALPSENLNKRVSVDVECGLSFNWVHPIIR